MEKFLIRQTNAPEMLDMSEPFFNEHVRPYLTQIVKGKSIWYDPLDLMAWVAHFKAANGKPGIPMEEPCLNQPPALEKEKASGISKKLLPDSEFTKALEKRNSTRQSAI
jgi:hypothetical protein